MDHLLWIDVVVYGVVIGVLTLVNFIIVVFVVEAHASAPAVLGTRQAERCNTDYTSETCAYIFRGRGCAFGSLIVLVLLHAYVCKDLHLSIFHMNITDNRFLALTFFLGLAILPLTYYVSFLCNQWFYQAPITWEWGLIVLSGIVFLLFSECYKACIRKRLFLSEEDELRRRANENRVEIDIDQQGDELVLVRDTNNKTNLNRREHNVMNATH